MKNVSSIFCVYSFFTNVNIVLFLTIFIQNLYMSVNSEFDLTNIQPILSNLITHQQLEQELDLNSKIESENSFLISNLEEEKSEKTQIRHDLDVEHCYTLQKMF